MAYKKYIQRNGKLYGPYLYESKRVDGKVVSEYKGSEEPKKSKGVKVFNYKKTFSIFMWVVLFAFLVYFLFNLPENNKISGNAILGVESLYEKGEPLDGVLKFSLNEGELIPSSSKIIFENNGKNYEFLLSDVIDENTFEGKYYIKEKDISGEGSGYGVEGEKEIYPEVKFILQIYNEANEETVVAEDVTVEENLKEENVAPITGNSVKNSGGFLSSLFGMTGMVSMELESEIEGSTSKDKPFVYELKEGEIAEVKPKSVFIGDEEVSENVVSLIIENNKLTVSTDYFEVEKGYGKDYVGNKEKTISLDLSDLNLILEEGNLNIKLIYDEVELLSLSTLLEDGEETSEEIIEEDTEETEEVVEVPSELEEDLMNVKNESVEEIVDSSLWDISDFLTIEEKEVLTKKFGKVELKTIKSEVFKERIIKAYEIGEYNIEYSYDSSLNEDILKVQMERDRIKFLKDISNSILKEESVSNPVEGLNENYAF